MSLSVQTDDNAMHTAERGGSLRPHWEHLRCCFLLSWNKAAAEMCFTLKPGWFSRFWPVGREVEKELNVDHVVYLREWVCDICCPHRPLCLSLWLFRHPPRPRFPLPPQICIHTFTLAHLSAWQRFQSPLLQLLHQLNRVSRLCVLWLLWEAN